MTELKPCPFCGKMPKIEVSNILEDKGSFIIYFSIRCSHCGTSRGKGKYHITIDPTSPCGTNIYEDEREKGIAEWNKRYDAND